MAIGELPFFGTFSRITVVKVGHNSLTNVAARTLLLEKSAIVRKEFELNRFHQAARNLSEEGQNNIRILRGWAKSKGWVKAPNSGGPEKWGVVKNGEFEWNLLIKPESSMRPNFIGKIGNSGVETQNGVKNGFRPEEQRIG